MHAHAKRHRILELSNLGKSGLPEDRLKGQRGRVVPQNQAKYHGRMHVITRKRLNEFAEKFPETKSALAHWYMALKKGNFSNIAELRSVFPTADRVGKLTVFNIGGNRVRLIAAIHYNRKKVYIRAVLTHTEYDEGQWKE